MHVKTFVGQIVVERPAEQRRIIRKRRGWLEAEFAIEQQLIVFDGQRIVVRGAQHRAIQPPRGEKDEVSPAQLLGNRPNLFRIIRRINLNLLKMVVAWIAPVNRHKRGKFPRFGENRRAFRNRGVNRPRCLNARIVAMINGQKRGGIPGGIREHERQRRRCRPFPESSTPKQIVRPDRAEQAEKRNQRQKIAQEFHLKAADNRKDRHDPRQRE